MPSLNNIPDPSTPKSNAAPPLIVGDLAQGKIIGAVGHGKSWYLKVQLIKAINEVKAAAPGPEAEKPALLIDEEWHPITTTETTHRKIMALTKAARSHPPKPKPATLIHHPSDLGAIPDKPTA